MARSVMRAPHIVWGVVFGLSTIFQIWRDAPGDALIYGFATVVVLLDGLIPNGRSERPAPLAPILIVALLAAIFLNFAELYSTAIKGALIALGLAALLLTRRHDTFPINDLAITRGKRLWMALALTASIWEVSAYILADRFHDDGGYPTITVLVDPVINTQLGRTLFISFWFIFGWDLMRIWSRP